MGSSTSPLDKEMIGRRLAAVRAELGLSQAALADQVSLSKRAYIHYERGEREVPTGLIKALYDLHGIDPVWLMSGTEAQPQKARTGTVDFKLVDMIVLALDRELEAVGRQMRPEHRARVIKALYQLGIEQGRISQEIVSNVVAVAVSRGR